MATTTRMFLLEDLRKRYNKATKANKIIMLDEFCKNFNYHRKYAIALLTAEGLDINNTISCKKRGPKPKYRPNELLPIIKELWFASDQVCSKKLEAMIPFWLAHYERLNGAIEPILRDKVLSIKSATIDRMLVETKARIAGKGRCGTKPGTLLKNQIPLHDNQWNDKVPGFLEADTVAHCGNSIAGDFVWTLTMTDICSGWTELRATWSKGSTGVVEKIRDIEKILPFDLKGFDCDNGSEFLNYHLLKYFANHKPAIQFTRSRPYKKNDNAHVEQKNWSCVRQLIGYDRIENKEALDIMNDIYSNEWSLLNNFFIPTMKLEKKMRIGAKIKKIYAKPMTPYARLIASPHISAENKAKLTAKYNLLDPFELKKSMEHKLKRLFSLIKIAPEIRHPI